MYVSICLSIAFVKKDAALVAANLQTTIERWLYSILHVDLSLSIYICMYVSTCLSIAFVEGDVALVAANL